MFVFALIVIALTWLIISQVQMSKQEAAYDKEIQEKVAAKAAAESAASSNTPPPDYDALAAKYGGSQTANTAPATLPKDYSGWDPAPTNAQPSPAATPAGPKPAQPRPHRDLGVDVASPTYSHVSLMDTPDTNGAVVRSVTANDVLVLVDRTPSNGWYDVIDVRSGKEGWVSQDDVQISFTKHPEQAAKFTEEYTGSDDPPEISVENATSGVLNLKVDGNFYSVQPNSTISISLSGGSSSYYATEPGAIPAMGKKDFERGYRYSWRFWIETSYVPVP
ncbi:MAG: SH3 domain-containing protein [Terracidiphilus sp.]